MNILVTGGAGFIGSHVVDALIADSHRVYVLDNLSTGALENLPKGVTLFEHALLDDLTPLFSKVKFDVVFHLAAQIDVRRSIEHPRADAEQDIVGTLNLLDTMLRFGCKRIIFSSTGGALYGDTARIPTPESAPTKPESPYGVAKLAIEGYLHAYATSKGLSVCVLRYANVYGPRQALNGEAGVVAVFARKILAEQQPTIFGDGKQTRDYVYVRDVVDANLLALHKKLTGTYNIGTGQETSVNELYAKLAKMLSYPWKAQYGPAVKGEVRRSALQCDAISGHWRPRYELDRGLAETIEWLRERRH